MELVYKHCRCQHVRGSLIKSATPREIEHRYTKVANKYSQTTRTLGTTVWSHEAAQGDPSGQVQVMPEAVVIMLPKWLFGQV